jgi:DNA-directed RNA polymerase subunit RPC12/RpoP
MAVARRFVCSNCNKTIEAWSDGNPYYFDDSGLKKYAYHPDHANLAKCSGNDTPHLCLGCGDELTVDSQSPITNCSKCGHGEIACTFDLEAKPCPYCGKGVFAADPDFICVS